MIRWVILVLTGVVLAATGSVSAEDPVVSTLAADEFVTVRDTRYENGVVTGTLRNDTDATLRDVRLRILCSWRWEEEKNPGDDDPSWGAIHEIEKIPPGETVAFRHEGPPAPTRDDGRFHVEVTVAGLRSVRTLD